MNFFTQSFSLSVITMLAMILAGFSGGYLMRTLQRNKAKSRILRLEDEMLRNHAKILSLEKNISDLKKENNLLRNTQLVRRTQEGSRLHT